MKSLVHVHRIKIFLATLGVIRCFSKPFFFLNVATPCSKLSLQLANYLQLSTVLTICLSVLRN